MTVADLLELPPASGPVDGHRARAARGSDVSSVRLVHQAAQAVGGR